jgi:hypothetical protein
VVKPSGSAELPFMRLSRAAIAGVREVRAAAGFALRP